MTDSSELSSPYASDDHLARLFVKEFGADFRFCHGSRRWYRREGAQWLPEPTPRMQQRARDVIGRVLRDALRLPTELQRPARSLAVLTLAAEDPAVALPGNKP